MTVAELIEKLKEAPQDSEVIMAHWGRDRVFTPYKVVVGFQDPYGGGYSEIFSAERTEDHTEPIVVLEA